MTNQLVQKRHKLETKRLNEVAGRKRIQISDLDNSQVIDITWNADIKGSSKGGGKSS